MDWKKAAHKAAHWSLPAGLTGLSLGWTVYAVGEILSHQAPAPLAYTVAGIYDAVWLYALAMETAHRRQGSKATLPTTLGWLFLITSVGVLFTHGLLYATAVVAVIGAVVPAAAKATLIMAVERRPPGSPARRRRRSTQCAARRGTRSPSAARSPAPRPTGKRRRPSWSARSTRPAARHRRCATRQPRS